MPAGLGTPRRLAACHCRPASRELTVLHPSVAVRYVRLVAAVAPTVERMLSDVVAANRVASASEDPPMLRLRAFRAERAAFGRRLAELVRSAPCVVFADVRSCYPSIGPDAVSVALSMMRCPARPVRELVWFLRRLAGFGVPGLPVGPDASAVLANAVLASADRALEEAGLRHLRWVDDVIVAVRDRGEAARALVELRTALAGAGLRLNAAKTRVVVDPSLDAAATVSLAREAAR